MDTTAATYAPAHHGVTVRHNFETAHRLPHLGGKCTNLHGHSWWVEVSAVAPALDSSTVVEFGAFKAELRSWIDTHLDHGAMLGVDDPLAKVLADHGSKLFRFGAPQPLPAEEFAANLPHPTVEAVAVLLGRVAMDVLVGLGHAPGARIEGVRVTETHVNSALWRGGSA
ncbi:MULTISPECIES: 6-pyruvoyl trahydropterin synthase family protein [Nocardiopsidaceae]|jgi:6-pyruvoyltetrahydropterin/6-carboxytetrahydropterin synthase|uniref:6-carboxy-5,6,7,8-tetrahydropterin synthase n=2 Tax=Nocardiopsidaceae TaxID=83676 RepID=A0ABY6YGJ7_9ACTN|nr:MULTISPECIES: 6-carboxytetrahydropterin synthase [Nocardiopsaceae]MEE2046600.1 6-carboxytetrahydropterin synthase [Nocardiopsis tropica]MEE2050994.1 6-carboxytetrahydropterin synthase [Nocardiopsis umidischolae]WAE71372.1 6-carboxytetrahydropterin synthase [Streptomonospora nanhaiensis]